MASCLISCSLTYTLSLRSNLKCFFSELAGTMGDNGSHIEATKILAFVISPVTIAVCKQRKVGSYWDTPIKTKVTNFYKNNIFITSLGDNSLPICVDLKIL
eukprot:NODE_575_length_6553_cov_0.185156.p6 type:complete len:101 gc:universal NODE_575_length_6553_cov_0.185156:2624-2322(-)